MADIDLSKLPAGQRRWRELIEWVAALDDTAERYFLELKSQSDLSTKLGDGRAKVAKFILGAANRSPEQAARRFGGYALMILGVDKGAINGIPSFEAKDLQQEVVKYCGPDGPEWDFERIDMGDNKHVVVIVVDPPKLGHEPWACQADGPENLFNGVIYIRVDGATRKATGPELHQLHARFREGLRPKPLIEIEVVGQAVRFTCDDSVLEGYIESVSSDLRGALPAPEPTGPKSFKTISRLEAARLGVGLDSVRAVQDALYGMDKTIINSPLSSKPEPRTVEAYEAEIDDWAARTRDAWQGALDEVMAWSYSPVEFQVINKSEAFLKDLEVDIHIYGPIEGVQSRKGERFDFKDRLPKLPRKWGPIPSSLLGFSAPSLDFLGNFPDPGPGYGDVSFSNGGSVSLNFDLVELRPKRAGVSNGDILLIARDHAVTASEGTWEITASAYDQVFSGKLTLTTDPKIFIIDNWVRGALLPPTGVDES